MGFPTKGRFSMLANFRVREVRGSRPTLTVICGWSSLGIDRGCVRSHRAEQFGASTRLILASGAPRDTAGAAGATRAAGAVGAAGTPDHIDGRVDSLGESKRSGDALSVEDPTRSLTSTADSTTASSGASILVQGLEGRSWAEKAQHARKLLAGLLALSRPHNFLPSVLLVLLGAFLGASSAGSGTAAMTAATANISATAAAAAKTAAATAATAATATAAASLPALPVWLSPRVLLVAALSGSIALASMVVNDVFDWQIGSDRVNSPAKPLVSGAVHPYDAELAAGCLYSLIVLAACQLEPLPLRMLVAGAAVGTYLYTPFLKRITLVKNVSVAAIIASSLLAGALAAGASFSALYRASGAFLFLFHALLYREVLMDVADVTGDASAGVPTLAVRLGKQRAVMVACGMLVLAHAAGSVPCLVVPTGPKSHRRSLALSASLDLLESAIRVRAGPLNPTGGRLKRADQCRPHQSTPLPALPPSRPCSPSPAANDVIRGASGQDVSATSPPAVATAIAVGSTFAFNFTAARCTNLPTTASSATVQWTSAAAATANVPACENVTFLTGPDCTGVVASSVAKPSSPTTYTSRAILPYPYPLSALCFIAGDAAWWPTEVAARVVVATAVAVGAYKVAFDPSSRCATVPAGTAPAGVSTPVGVQWGSSSSLAGGGASARCNVVSFFPGASCDGAVMQHLYSFSSSNPTSITPSTYSPLTTVRCKFSSNTACKYATCPANSVCAETNDNRGATCRCQEGFIGVNGTCQDKCNLDCMANSRCVRDASGAPDCVCNKGFQYSPDSNTCVDKCDSVNCGPNGKCIKDADGNPTCACNAGFQMPPDNLTCVDKCELVTCAANSRCSKDASGNTTCDCVTGFERLPGNDTCVDKCASVNCQPNSTCKKDANGIPACSCNTGFTLSSDKLTCIDNCFGRTCGLNGKCVKKENGDPTCACNTGYQMDTDRFLCITTQCYALGCGLDGECVNDINGRLSCRWNSPCGSCPTGAVCKTIQVTTQVTATVPYCQCRSGYGMTSTGCIYGAPDQVIPYSITLFKDRTAAGNASKPYTFRLKYGCTQFPEGLAGNFKTWYEVDYINNALGCRVWRYYTTDNCTSSPARSGTIYATTMYANAY
ncbi:unnamed protein product, partial [Closterium sp. NIES-64]